MGLGTPAMWHRPPWMPVKPWTRTERSDTSHNVCVRVCVFFYLSWTTTFCHNSYFCCLSLSLFSTPMRTQALKALISHELLSFLRRPTNFSFFSLSLPKILAQSPEKKIANKSPDDITCKFNWISRPRALSSLGECTVAGSLKRHARDVCVRVWVDVRLELCVFFWSRSEQHRVLWIRVNTQHWIILAVIQSGLAVPHQSYETCWKCTVGLSIIVSSNYETFNSLPFLITRSWFHFYKTSQNSCNVADFRHSFHDSKVPT